LAEVVLGAVRQAFRGGACHREAFREGAFPPYRVEACRVGVPEGAFPSLPSLGVEAFPSQDEEASPCRQTEGRACRAFLVGEAFLPAFPPFLPS